MWTFVKNILQLIISPDNGWDDVAQAANQARARRGMFWLIAFAALSVFVQLFYEGHAPVVKLCQEVVIIAVTYWTTLFLADFLLKLWIPRMNDGALDERMLQLLVYYSVSLLSLQVVITNILPLTFAILELWPIYVVVIMWRAMKVLELPEAATGKYLLAVIATFIVPTQLLLRGFNSLLLQ